MCTPLASLPLSHNLHIVGAGGYSRGLEANALSRLICTWSEEFAISLVEEEREKSLDRFACAATE